MEDFFPSHVRIGQGCWEELTAQLPGPYSSLAVLSDQRVSSLYQSNLNLTGLSLTVPESDSGKTLDVAADCWKKMHAFRMDRQSLLIALGGGAITDLGGFIASCYLRGIPAIYLPTTLLGMVDAAIGGKTGVNLETGKNLVGTFAEPQQVFLDPQCLQSLSQRDFCSGLAEVIKYGMILDPNLLTFLEGNRQRIFDRDPAILETLVRRSVELKWSVVSSDQKEKGRRAILNYGHTFAHAIETLTEYAVFTHGEAVAIGMHCAAQLGVAIGLTPPDTVKRHQEILHAFDLPSRLPSLDIHKLVACMKGDKKVEKGKVSFILLKKEGEAEKVSDIADQTVIHTLNGM